MPNIAAKGDDHDRRGRDVGGGNDVCKIKDGGADCGRGEDQAGISEQSRQPRCRRYAAQLFQRRVTSVSATMSYAPAGSQRASISQRVTRRDRLHSINARPIVCRSR